MFIDFEEDMYRVDVCEGVCKGRVSSDRNKDELRAVLSICRTLLLYFPRNVNVNLLVVIDLQIVGRSSSVASAGNGRLPGGGASLNSSQLNVDGELQGLHAFTTVGGEGFTSQLQRISRNMYENLGSLHFGECEMIDDVTSEGQTRAVSQGCQTQCL